MSNLSVSRGLFRFGICELSRMDLVGEVVEDEES
jgi:hypothetical protein